MITMKQIIYKNQSGYIALIAVLIISAAALAISLSLNTLSIGETESGLLKQQSTQSFALAEACMQEAYLRLGRNGDYSGGQLNTELGSCTITVASDNSDRIITVNSEVNSQMRRLESRVTIGGGSIIVGYWKELSQ